MKTRDQILSDIKKLRSRLDQAVACQNLVGTEGFRILVEAVNDEIRQAGRRLMQTDCGPDETNALRAEIKSLNWFSRWSVDRAKEIQDLVKRMEGLQSLAQKRHDAGSKDQNAEIDALVAEVQKYQTQVSSHE